MILAIRAEFAKLRSTNTWWLMALGVVGFTALALALNMLQAHFELGHRDETIKDTIGEGKQRDKALAEEHERYAKAHTAIGLAKIATNLYTSGQFFGLMLIMVMGTVIVTSEYFQQTATSTYLAIPHRVKVILAKFVVGICYGALAWVIMIALAIPAGAIFLGTRDVTTSLGTWDVTRGLLLSLAAFALWAVLGVSLGVLIRSQIWAVVIGTALYTIGMLAAEIVFMAIRHLLIKEDWVLTAEVILPSVATTVMVTPGEAYEHAPPQWVGAAVLIGYTVVAGVIGTLITRKRDIS